MWLFQQEKDTSPQKIETPQSQTHNHIIMEDMIGLCGEKLSPVKCWKHTLFCVTNNSKISYQVDEVILLMTPKDYEDAKHFSHFEMYGDIIPIPLLLNPLIYKIDSYYTHEKNVSTSI